MVRMRYTTNYAGTRYTEGNTYTVDDRAGKALTSGSNPPAVRIVEPKAEAEVEPTPVKAKSKKRK